MNWQLNEASFRHFPQLMGVKNSENWILNFFQNNKVIIATYLVTKLLHLFTKEPTKELMIEFDPQKTGHSPVD